MLRYIIVPIFKKHHDLYTMMLTTMKSGDHLPRALGARVPAGGNIADSAPRLDPPLLRSLLLGVAVYRCFGDDPRDLGGPPAFTLVWMHCWLTE